VWSEMRVRPSDELTRRVAASEGRLRATA
jgi:hypothetical protein